MEELNAGDNSAHRILEESAFSGKDTYSFQIIFTYMYIFHMGIFSTLAVQLHH